MSKNMIHLSGEYTREEGKAQAGLTPGHLVEKVGESGEIKYKKHSTAKGFAERAFAQEDALQGNTIDDDYSTGDLVSVNICESGAQVYAWLKAGTNYVIGDKLVSAGDGTLQKVSSNDLDLVAVLEEAVDLSASSAVATRAQVQIK